VPPNTNHFGANFNVHNNNTSANTANVTCSTTGNLTCVTTSVSVTLAAGETKVVQFIYNSGATNPLNTIKATAVGCGGSAKATVVIT
jgi:hypothetical protein